MSHNPEVKPPIEIEPIVSVAHTIGAVTDVLDETMRSSAHHRIAHGIPAQLVTAHDMLYNVSQRAARAEFTNLLSSPKTGSHYDVMLTYLDGAILELLSTNIVALNPDLWAQSSKSAGLKREHEADPIRFSTNVGGYTADQLEQGAVDIIPFDDYMQTAQRNIMRAGRSGDFSLRYRNYVMTTGEYGALAAIACSLSSLAEMRPFVGKRQDQEMRELGADLIGLIPYARKANFPATRTPSMHRPILHDYNHWIKTVDTVNRYLEQDGIQEMMRANKKLGALASRDYLDSRDICHLTSTTIVLGGVLDQAMHGDASARRFYDSLGIDTSHELPHERQLRYVGSRGQSPEPNAPDTTRDSNEAAVDTQELSQTLIADAQVLGAQISARNSRWTITQSAIKKQGLRPVYSVFVQGIKNHTESLTIGGIPKDEATARIGQIAYLAGLAQKHPSNESLQDTVGRIIESDAEFAQRATTIRSTAATEAISSKQRQQIIDMLPPTVQTSAVIEAIREYGRQHEGYALEETVGRLWPNGREIVSQLQRVFAAVDAVHAMDQPQSQTKHAR